MNSSADELRLARTRGIVAGRPDGYIGLIANTSEPEEARRYFRHIAAD